MITGPFASVRELADGEAVRLQQSNSAGQAHHGHNAERRGMNQLSRTPIRIALQAIWANKLRSFMTVLGNIVAVTSIVTVVTLIQGMNAMVSNAIVSDVGADSFTIQRQPPIRNEDDEERTRNNPLLTMDEARRDPRVQPPHHVGRRRRRGRSATVSYRDDGDRQHHRSRVSPASTPTSPTSTPSAAG